MRRRSLALLAGLIAATAVGCGSDDTAEDGAEGASLTLRYGAIMPLTGSLASFGPSVSDSLNIAVNYLEDHAASEGLSVELVGIEDGQSETAPSVQAATKLVQTQDANVVVGTLASSSTIAIAQSVTTPNDVLLIPPLPSAPEISDLNDNDLVWRISSPDTVQSEVLAQVAAEAFGSDATLNVAARNDAFGQSLQRLFTHTWEAQGGTIGESVTYNPESPNLDTVAQQIASGNPDGFVLIEYPESYERLAPGLVRAGTWSPEVTFMNAAMRNNEALESVGDAATVGLRGVSPTSKGAAARPAFNELFAQQSDLEPTGFEPATFDAVILPFLAAVAAGSDDPNEIKRHMQAVSGPPGAKVTFQDLDEAIRKLQAGEEIDYEGAWGPIDWDTKGDPTAAQFELWEKTENEIRGLETFTFGQDGG